MFFPLTMTKKVNYSISFSFLALFEMLCRTNIPLSEGRITENNQAEEDKKWNIHEVFAFDMIIQLLVLLVLNNYIFWVTLSFIS